MATTSILVTNKGTFGSLELAPSTGSTGDYIQVGDKTYTWSTTDSDWKEVVSNLSSASSTTDTHDKGTFSTIYKVHAQYPSGGAEGDYVTIQGYRHYWNASRGTWVVTKDREDYWDHQLGALSEQIGNIASLSNAMSAYFAAGYLYAGVIGPLSQVSVGTVKVIYIAHTAGVYHNCGDLIVEDGVTAILKWNGAIWTKDVLLFAKASDLTALKTEVDNIKAELNDIIHCTESDVESTEYSDF